MNSAGDSLLLSNTVQATFTTRLFKELKQQEIAPLANVQERSGLTTVVYMISKILPQRLVPVCRREPAAQDPGYCVSFHADRQLDNAGQSETASDSVCATRKKGETARLGCCCL